MEWGDPRERPCRPHEWTDLEVGTDHLVACGLCHVRRCDSGNASGRCTLAIHHPSGTHHRYPDLMSEPVGGMLLDPAKSRPRPRRRREDPPPAMA